MCISVYKKPTIHNYPVCNSYKMRYATVYISFNWIQIHTRTCTHTLTPRRSEDLMRPVETLLNCQSTLSLLTRGRQHQWLLFSNRESLSNCIRSKEKSEVHLDVDWVRWRWAVVRNCSKRTERLTVRAVATPTTENILVVNHLHGCSVKWSDKMCFYMPRRILSEYAFFAMRQQVLP